MLETWLDPAAIAIVFAGTLAATLLRCGVADCRIALAALSGLFDKPFDPAQAKAELSVQVREIAEAKQPDLNANDIDAASKIIAGTARSMGITVED